ncbi:MAG: hypothetical protein Kow00122_11270 [Thermoleophilia bacterium]
MDALVHGAPPRTELPPCRAAHPAPAACRLARAATPGHSRSRCAPRPAVAAHEGLPPAAGRLTARRDGKESPPARRNKAKV